MLDYKDIILKHYSLHMTGFEIARQLRGSKAGVNGFLQTFEACDKLLFHFRRVLLITVYFY